MTLNIEKQKSRPGNKVGKLINLRKDQFVKIAIGGFR